MKENRKSLGAWAGLIMLVTTVTYLPAMRGEFVFDDDSNIAMNPLLRTPAGLVKTWTSPRASPQYYPLTYTAYWIEYRLWGLNPVGYHVVNVLLHGVNAFLTGLLLARLAVPGAWVGALLFAIHPVHVESVAWISELKNVLSGFFYLSALLTYLRFVDSPERRWRLYAVAWILYLAALLSKTSAVSMPLAAFLILWWKRDRIRGRDLLSLVPFVLAGAGLGLLTARLEVTGSYAAGPEWQLSLAERCLIAGRVLWFYTSKLVWPHPLMIMYPRWEIDSAVWWQYLFPTGAVVVLLFLWFGRRRFGKGPLVAAFFFAGMLVPTPAIIDIGFMRFSFVADHWLYLPSIALIALATGGIEKLLKHQALPAWAAGIVVAVLSLLSWQHAKIFRNQETLFRDNLVHNPRSWGAHYNLGVVLRRSGRVNEAIEHYERALQFKPDYADVHNNLGVALQLVGRIAEAIPHYQEAARLKPEMVDAHYNLGVALEQTGKLQEAVPAYEQALRLEPDGVEARNRLALVLVRLDRVPEAIRYWEQAVRIKPDDVEAHSNLAVALEGTGQTAEAIRQYEQVLRLNPGNAAAQNRLARLRAGIH